LTFSGPQSVLSSEDKIAEAGKSLVAHMEATPGVVSATEVESQPFEGQSLFIMKVVSSTTPAAERDRVGFTPFEFVTPDYFRTFEIPIRSGRGFLATDTKGAEKVVVVSETLAERLWPHENAVGKQLVQVINKSSWTVIGVATDTHLRELKNGGPVVYFNGEQVQPFWNGYLVVRTTLPLAQMMPSLRKATDDVGLRLGLWDAKTMDELLAKPLAQPRLSALLLSGFSVVALLLSVVGLYGVMSSMVRQQTRDIGVRLALGATAGNIRDLVLGEAGRVVGIGAALGIAGAMFGGRLLSSQLFGVAPIDPLSLSLTATALLVAAAVAAFLPARRASKIDPVQALRSE
jgi:predicted permease